MKWGFDDEKFQRLVKGALQRSCDDQVKLLKKAEKKAKIKS